MGASVPAPSCTGVKDIGLCHKFAEADNFFGSIYLNVPTDFHLVWVSFEHLVPRIMCIEIKSLCPNPDTSVELIIVYMYRNLQPASKLTGQTHGLSGHDSPFGTSSSKGWERLLPTHSARSFLYEGISISR